MWPARLTALLAGSMAVAACSFALDSEDFAKSPAVEGPTVSPDGASATSPRSNETDDDGDAGVAEPCETADLTKSTHHCGRCDHDCLGGVCSDGGCEPVVVKAGLQQVIGVAVSGDRVFIGAQNTVKSMAFDAGDAFTISKSSASIGYMTATATHVYWTTGGKVVRSLHDGGAEEALATGVDSLLGIAVSPEHVYFTRYTAAGSVERVPLGGGPREVVLANYGNPEDVEIANGELVVGGDGVNALEAYANGGFGNKRVLSGGGGPVSMAASGNDVFFVQQGDSTIQRVPLAGGSRQFVAFAGGFPCGIAATSKLLFWINCNGGELMRLVR